MANTTLPTRLNRFLSGDIFDPWNEWFNDKALNKALTVPKVNITEGAAEYKLAVAAPGLHKEDFRIDVDRNILTISAQREERKEHNEEKVTREEYNYSSFTRSFGIPEDVQQDKIAASYDGGILKLVLPKREAPGKTAKSINVQ